MEMTAGGLPYSKAVGYLGLPEANIFAPENGWLEDEIFLLGFGPFSGANC